MGKRTVRKYKEVGRRNGLGEKDTTKVSTAGDCCERCDR